MLELHTLLAHPYWCDCLECDQRIEALRALIVGRGNRDDNLMLALIHFSHSSAAADPTSMDTTYHVFGKLYYLLTHRGEIQDPQLVDWDEDEDEDDDDL